MFKYFYAALFLFTAGALSGQGWERVYDGGGYGEIRDIATAQDGGFILAGNYGQFTQVRLFKTDQDGYLQWTKDFPLGGATSAEAVVATSDGGYAVVGSYTVLTIPTKKQGFLLKTDKAGNLLWLRQFNSTTDAELFDLAELPDGSLVACGYRKETNNPEYDDALVIKTTADGNQLWLTAYGSPNTVEKSYALALTGGGNLVVVGEKGKTPREIYVFQISSGTGNLAWVNEFGTPLEDDAARDVVIAPDGNITLSGRKDGSGVLMKIGSGGNNSVLWSKTIQQSEFFGLSKAQNGGYFATGNKSSASGFEDLYIVKTDEQGNFLCENIVGRPGFDQGFCAQATPDGGVVVGGNGEFFVTSIPETKPYLVRADKNCTVFTSYITGRIFHDFIANCQQDASEAGLEDWILKVESPNYTRFAVSTSGGYFELLADTGSYNIILYPPNEYWKSCGAITLPVTAFTDTFSIDIPVQSAFDCPNNEVDVATPVLRRCTDNVYTVRYCNSGTSPSPDTKIEVTLDPFLSFQTSSIAPVSQQGNTYTFNIGLLANGDCGSFTITANLDCNTTITGQAHCVTAHIYPDSFCNTPGWDGSIVSTRAICVNDTVRLSIKNVGISDMSDFVQFVITEDVIMLTAPFDPQYRVKLTANQDSMVWQQPATGSTYRIIANQTPGYPGLSYPTAAVEGCGAADSSSFALGYYTMFPDDEAEPFKAADCQESYDTDFNPLSLKRGHPKGYDVEHYVEPEADLEFLIQFQNSGTDTVHQVVIRDTLSTYLDPSTVHPGAASHPYDFDLTGNGIVQFTLPNLNLVPGSSASEGYVTFRVSQKSDLPCDTKIFNSAAIYLDFNAPVFTNQTFHTVCKDSIFVATDDIHVIGADVKVYPNPFVESAVFEITGVVSNTGFTLELYDVLGKKVFNQSYPNSTFRLHRHHLPAGFLFYRLTTEKGKPVASGKLLVR